MAPDCLLLLLLASAVAAMEGNVASAEQVGGWRPYPRGCSGCFAPPASRDPRAPLLGSPDRSRARGWGGTPGAPPASSQSPQTVRGAPGPRAARVSRSLGSSRGSRSPLHCGAGSLAPGAPGVGDEGTARALRPAECGRLSAPLLSWPRMRLGGRASPLLFLSSGSAGSGLWDRRASAERVGREALPWCPESGRGRGAEFIAVPSVVPELVELIFPGSSRGEADTFIAS